MTSSRQQFATGNQFSIQSAPYAGATERMAIYKPRYWKGDGTVPAIIYCPALGAGAYNILGWFCSPELVKRGFPVICADIGTTPTRWDINDGVPLFGSTDALDKLTLLIEWATTPVDTATSFSIMGLGAYPNKVILHGGSMGGQTATLYAHDFPTKIDSVFTDIAAFDPESVRQANTTTVYYPGGLADPIVAALGGPPVPDAKQGMKMGPTWPISIPYWGWYEGSDGFTPEASYDSFKADMIARGAAITFIKTGDGGHTTARMPWTELTDLTEQRAQLLMG